jgi:hypothetical protein
MRSFLIVLSFAVCAAAEPTQTPTLIAQLIETNKKISTIQCEIRRETRIEDELAPATLSRVWFQSGNLLRVETSSPQIRRIIVDGNTIYKWMDGDKQGVRIPLADAPEAELLQVQRVPASGEEHLRRLKGLSEKILPPDPDYPVRRLYEPPSPHPNVTVSLDSLDRLARIEFFDKSDPKLKLGQVDFSGWKEAKPGIWIACRQNTHIKTKQGNTIDETLRVSRLVVNEPIPEEQFCLSPEERQIEFVTVEDMKLQLQQ